MGALVPFFSREYGVGQAQPRKADSGIQALQYLAVMAKLQPKTPDVWTIGFNPRQEAFMLSVMATILAVLGLLIYLWLQHAPLPFHWAWTLAGLVALGFTLEWVFFEDLWVVDRRTRTAYWCRPFRKTKPIALDDGAFLEAKQTGSGALEIHLVLNDGKRFWLTRDRCEVVGAAVQDFGRFIGLPVREP